MCGLNVGIWLRRMPCLALESKATRLLKVMTFLVPIVLHPQLFAEDRALIVGVGDYQSISDLPGIDLDVDMMKDVAELLGFSSHQIKTLRDSEATLDGVRLGFRDWLGQAGGDDRVLFYFSGHGSHVDDDNGDETDSQDEVLVVHDSTLGTEPRNVLRDDEIALLLKDLPSRNTLVLVDACHSGTVTKSTRIGPGVPKYAPAPTSARGTATGRSDKSIGVTGDANYALLAAAEDDDVAMATPKGSAFTLGVDDAIRSAASAASPLTLVELRDKVDMFIPTVVDSDDAHTPQLSGNSARFRQNLMNEARSRPRPTWRELERLADSLDPFEFRAENASYLLGNSIVLTAVLPRAGYLNVVNVGPTDSATVLFPNSYHRDNAVDAGSFRLPTDQMDFTLTAVEPVGESITLAFLSDEPINLYEDTVKGRDVHGRIVDVLVPLSAKGRASVRSIAVEAATKRNSASAGKVHVTVRQ